MSEFGLGTARGRIEIDTTSLAKAGAATTAFNKTMLSSMQSTSANLMKTGKSLTMGLTLPIVALGAYAVKSFNEAARAAADTEAVITSTGGAAHVTAGHVTELANSIRDYSGFDDEAVRAGENMLLTFTNIRNEVGAGNDVFDQATEILADMSAKFGGDMSQSAVKLGKALNDPLKGITALTRVGVVFTDQQKEQVAAMMSNGDIMGAQKVILGELTTEFGGLAKAQGETDWGKTQIAVSHLQDTFERLGGVLSPIIADFVGFISDLVGGFLSLPGPVKLAAGILVIFLAALGPLTFIIGFFIKQVVLVAKVIEFMRIVMAAATGQTLLTRDATLALSAAQTSTAATAGNFIKSMLTAGSAANIAAIAAVGLVAAYVLINSSAGLAAQVGDDLAEIVLKDASMMDALTNSTGVTTEAERTFAASVDAVTANLAEQKAAADMLAGGLIGLVASAQDVAEKQRIVNKMQEAGNTSGAKYNAAILSLMGSQQSWLDSASDFVGGLHESGMSLDEAYRKAIALGKSIGIAKGDVLAALGPLAKFKGQLDGLPEVKKIEIITTFTTVGHSPIGGQQTIEFGATGGVFSGMTMVGEHGPELAFLPKHTGILEAETTLKLLRNLASRDAVPPISAPSAAPTMDSGPMQIVIEIGDETITKSVERGARQHRVLVGGRR